METETKIELLSISELQTIDGGSFYTAGYMYGLELHMLWSCIVGF